MPNPTRDDIDIQHTTREFVRREVYANVSDMVEYILRQEDSVTYDRFGKVNIDRSAPFSWDDVTNIYPDPTDWDLQECKDYISDRHGWDVPDSILEDIHGDDEEEIEIEWHTQMQDYIRDNPEAAEVYEWWLVSKWLADELSERGEVIIEPDIWGRQTTGQAVYMDRVMQDIAMEFAPAIN